MMCSGCRIRYALNLTHTEGGLMKVHKLKNEDNVNPLLKVYHLCESGNPEDLMSCRDNEVTCPKCLRKIEQAKRG